MAKRNKKSEKEKFLAEIERLKKELKIKKKYGLVWEEKQEEVVEVCKEKLPVVKEIKNKAIITDKNKPVNLLIEGDNYHALSVLNYTHAKKVDVIYIDPPYNTGNKEFIFNDKIVDLEDSYRHSKWLSFMEKRLKLAKNLLKDKGVIFISIDDNEMAQMKLLLDEIFYPSNFINIFVWNKKNVVQNDARFASVNHEYIVAYARNITSLGRFNLLPRTEELNARYSNPDSDPRGSWTSVALQAKSGTASNVYEVTLPNEVKWKPVPGTYPRLTKVSLLQAYHEGRLWFGKSGRNVPRLKKYLNEVKQGIVSNSLLFPADVGSTQSAKELIKRILNKNIFETPKPVNLIKKLMILGTNRDGIILDFMAGSGTTGHAVLELNKVDSGNRQFILCTNNENNICTDVCYPRVKKVIEGYRDSKGRKIEGLGGNLKYFKTDFVDAESTDKNKKKLTEQAIEMLCIKEGTFDSVLKRKHFKIFKNSNHYTGIIFDQLAIPEFKKTIKDIKGKFSIYVFSLSDETFDEEFADVKQKIKLSPIPEVILRVYRRIFR